MLGSIIQTSLECLALLIYANRPNWFIEWARFNTLAVVGAGDNANENAGPDADASTSVILYSNECHLLSWQQHWIAKWNCINGHMIDTMTTFLFFVSFAVRLSAFAISCVKQFYAIMASFLLNQTSWNDCKLWWFLVHDDDDVANCYELSTLIIILFFSARMSPHFSSTMTK